LATGKLGNGKICQRKIRGHEKNGNKKLMSEITATAKRQRKKTATGKMGNGKLGNRKTRQQKWTGRKRGQHM